MNYAESTLLYLECPECKQAFNSSVLQTICTQCQSPLLARYNLQSARATLTRENLRLRPRGIWRWSEILPVSKLSNRITLGEGDTAILRADHLGKKLGLNELYIKDESTNPTGSVQARGLAIALSRALELGIHKFAIPSAGNAGGALSAYAARAHAEAHVFMPQNTPLPSQIEVKTFGAGLVLVNGLLSDAAQESVKASHLHSWFDLSTFKEPYRCEGKKTLGLELAESFGWELPDVVIYPGDSGIGLVGMWKAFDELEEIGLIGPKRPRMVSVQAQGCAPIVRAFTNNALQTESWENAETITSGLRVTGVFADQLVLRTLYESGGTAVAVSDADILEHQKGLATTEGIFACLEGAAGVAALDKLLITGWIEKHERIVLFNTGSGLKYVS